MNEYQELIYGESNFGLDCLISLSKNNIPDGKKTAPWKNLNNHGTSLLSTELELWSYIASYGEMHAIKCRSAIQNLPFEELAAVEVVDWGCGQGLATMCLIESFQERNKLAALKKVILIEPSEAALRRAVINISKMIGSNVEVVAKNKYLPGKDSSSEFIDSLELTCSKTIHLFSNILDIPTINLGKLAGLISSTGKEHYVICVGPTYGKDRIDEFCSYFHPDEYFSDIESASYAYTSDTHKNITCKTKAFKFQVQNFNLQNVQNPSATISLDTPYTIYDEYNMSPEQDGAVPARTRSIYAVISKKLKAGDSIFISPSIGADTADIIIMRPTSRIVIINVYEDHPSTIDTNSQSNKKSPFDRIKTLKDDLIETHIQGLYDMCLKDTRYWGLIKTIVCFPNYSKTEVLDSLKASLGSETATNKFLNHTAILGKDMLDAAGIDKSFLEIFPNYKNSIFAQSLYDTCIELFAPRWHSYKEGRNDIYLDNKQKELSVSKAGVKQKICGIAGCGKTQIMVERAVNAQIRTGKTVLILTFNITLINYILSRINGVRKDFSWKKLEVINYHQFFCNQANRCGLKTNEESFDDENFFQSHSSQLKKYSSIFIDEVQDYKNSWLKLIYNYFLEIEGEFVVFGDEKQNIFDRPLDLKDKKVIVPGISGKWNELKNLHRFKESPIIDLAIDFQKRFLPNLFPDDVDSNLVFMKNGSIHYKEFNPVEISDVWQYCRQSIANNSINIETTVVLASQHKILRPLEQTCRIAGGYVTQITFETEEEWKNLYEKYPPIKDGNECKEDFRFSRGIDKIRQSRKRQFKMEMPGLKFSSIHSYKGWEAESVFLIIEQSETNDKLIYTAITRAKRNLYIINLGNQKYKDFFGTKTSSRTSGRAGGEADKSSQEELAQMIR